MVPEAPLAAGRIISMSIHVKLTPPATGPIGHTDEAALIGRGLIEESIYVLKRAAEAEGFTVEININQVVY
jgi:hypothetical protein